jgi:dimethylhistidine N-methyltransferase
MQQSDVTGAPLQGSVRVTDLGPAATDFLREAVAGLSASPPTLPSKFFYDERGSDLFREICELPEYYITRTETALLERYAGEMAASIGANAQLVGLGTGAGVKTRMLLQHLDNVIAYVPVDISKQRLIESAGELSRVMPHLEILPVVADYMQEFALPQPSRRPDHVAVYFPGSTIGNLQPESARAFLARICRLCGRDGGLIIGVDLEKPRAVLHAAYNDSAGVTAEFNRNVLVRANRELGANFVLECWQHRAIYNEQEHRIEMHLISEKEQTVQLGGREFRFREGDEIISEYSYKHTIEGFGELAKSAGFRRANVWTDPQQWFAVFHFVVA